MMLIHMRLFARQVLVLFVDYGDCELFDAQSLGDLADVGDDVVSLPHQVSHLILFVYFTTATEDRWRQTISFNRSLVL